jgi:hypothetical protein
MAVQRKCEVTSCYEPFLARTTCPLRVLAETCVNISRFAQEDDQRSCNETKKSI